MRNSYGKFKGIMIHHSLTKDSGTKSWEAIRDYHTDVNGWDDVGYHFGIERIENKYVIHTGRGLEYFGAHCPPNDTIGICVVGNYDLEEPHPALLAKLIRLVLGLMIVFDIEPVDVTYHRHHSEKTCPGSNFPESFLYNVSLQWDTLKGRHR